jgi:hypothetical protein
MAQSKSTKVELTCGNCGRTYLVYRYLANRSRYCSRACHDASYKRPPVIHPDGTATVPLTRGLAAVIDAADAEIVSRYAWCAIEASPGKFYAATNSPEGSTVYLHRFLTKAPAEVEVDHIDRDGLNNRRCNLRNATRSENLANTPRRSNNRSGYKGVCWVARDGKWVAQIMEGGKHRRIGLFVSAEDAARAYDAAAREQWGEYAHLNFPD